MSWLINGLYLKVIRRSLLKDLHMFEEISNFQEYVMFNIYIWFTIWAKIYLETYTHADSLKIT